jgi:hypothetical protein
MSGLLAHQRQYVLGPVPVRVRPDWISVQVGERLVLSHCPKLRVHCLRSRDGLHHYLLGLAVSAEPDVSSIAESFHLEDSADIEPWTCYWAGNWLLISENRCLQDASGSVGVLYRRVNGDLWISSSSALLGEHLPNVPPAARIPWRVAHNKGTDWIPNPFTMREGVYKLLPQRTMDPRDGSIRSIRFSERASAAGDPCEALASAIKAILVNWTHSGYRQYWLSLTAGLDTRTILAAASATRLDVQAYTDAYPITLRRDLVLPPRLAARVGVPYRLRKLPPLEESEREPRRAAISEHMDGATFHPIWDYDAGHNDGFPDDIERTFTAGNSFELGQCVYWNRFANVGLSEALPSVEQILDAFAFRSSWRPEPLSVWKQAMQSWIDSLSGPVPFVPDWRDRFYLDQRVGSWHATLSQGHAIFDAFRFCPANCLWIYHLVLSFSPEQMRQGFAQKEVIRVLAPTLLELPINPRSWPKRIKQIAKKLVGARGAHKLKPFARL